MTNKNAITEAILNTIKYDLIYGYRDEDGKKIYPSVKDASEWYNVSYDSLRRPAGKWNWKQKRKDEQRKISQKVKEKEKSEQICEAEAEAIIVNNAKYNDGANLLRRATVIEIQKIIDGEVVLYTTKEGDVKGVPRNALYLLHMGGKALESAQKVSMTAAGETTERSKLEIEANINVDERRESLKEKMHRIVAGNGGSNPRD